ncbi:MAG: SpoIIE family protein phosphatase, partial [Candidatus Omnitrophota bacterium]
QVPRELEKPVWTEPYYDDVIMTTYCVPFYEKTAQGRKLKGITTADISLTWLTETVSSIRVLKSGGAFLISRNGTIITHPSQDLIMNETLFSVAEARGDQALRKLGRRMVSGESGFVPFYSIMDNKKCWMYYSPVPSTGWSLAVIFPENELLEDVRRNTLIAALLGTGGIFLLVIVIVLLTNSITAPLRQIAKTAEAIGRGDLDIALPMQQSGDEVGKLAQTFRYMQSSLKDYIRQLIEATAAKERIESELKIAHEIQTGMLPRIFPPFPHRKEFNIFAMMEPAKEVGGDFYDFFLINEKKLFFVMGDVSGKGVPAALFMMIAKTLLKNEALQGSSADQVLNRVNNILALDNDAAMFATVFCGILDTETGEVEFANAGHNPPLVCSNKENFEFLNINKGFVLGTMADFKFKGDSIKLGHGDCLFLYTDGVTEAANPKQEFFSEARLKSMLSGLCAEDVTLIVREIREQIHIFAENEPQSDDITILAIRFI